jgi:hypothetical protein
MLLQTRQRQIEHRPERPAFPVILQRTVAVACDSEVAIGDLCMAETSVAVGMKVQVGFVGSLGAMTIGFVTVVRRQLAEG